jgi:peptide/nickel transport system substrate-binding protein
MTAHRAHVAAGVLLALGASVLTACGGSDSSSGSGSADSGTAMGSSIVVGDYSEPDSLDPQITDDDAGYPITWRVFEALTDFDQQGKLVPLLAAKLPTNTSPTTWTVTLRPGVTFSNGDPVNAAAVVFSLERIIDPKLKSSIQEATTIKSAKAVNDSTVQITTKAPDPLIPYELRAIKILDPKHATFPDDAVGSGPYEIASYDSGSQAVLEANPKYRGSQPSITTVTVKFIPDTTTRLQALQSGEIDISLGLDPSQADQVPQALSTAQGVSGGFVRINTLSGITKDPRVREALNLAVDKSAIVKLYDGYADAANCQMTPPQAFGTNPSLQAPPYDPTKAKQLLQDAGAEGATLDVSWPNGVFTLDKVVAQAVQQDWEAVGLKINMETKPFNPWLKDILATGPTAPALVFTESDNSLNDVSRQTTQYYAAKGAVSTYANPQVDQLVTKAGETFDSSKRASLDQQAEKAACDDNALVYLYFRKELFGASKDLQYQPHADIATKLYYDEMAVS